MSEDPEVLAPEPAPDPTPAVDLQPIVTLRYPRTFEGRQITELRMDFDRLSGRSMREAERRYLAGGGVPGAGAASLDFCGYCAATAADVPTELIDNLAAPDFNEAALLVQAFLLGMPWTDDAPSSSGNAA